MITEQQKIERMNYLGGSDCASALGLSEWKSQLQLWSEKAGLLKPEDISHKINVRFGNKFEQTVAELFEETTGKKLMKRTYTLYHDVYPFLACNLDRQVIGEDAIWEGKTVSAWRKKEFANDEFPQDMILQCHHNLMVSKKNICYLAVLIGNEDFKYTTIFRDMELEKQIMAKEVAFWNDFVVPKIMPMKIVSSDGSTLYQLFPVADPNKDIILGDEANALIERIDSSTAELKALENDIETYRNLLKAMLKENESGQTDKYRITWKSMETNRIDTEILKSKYNEIYKYCLKITKSRTLRYKSLDKPNG